MSDYTKEISNGEYGNGTKWRIQKVGSIYYYDIDACIIGFGDYITGWQNVARSMDLADVLAYRNKDLERLGGF